MSSYVLKRRGDFYFRIWIPQDLQHHFPYLEIKRSLRAKCHRTAKSLSRIEKVFMTLRANVLAPEQVHEYIQREIPSISKKTEVILSPLFPTGSIANPKRSRSS